MKPEHQTEPIAIADAEWMYRLRSNPVVNRYIEYTRPDSLEKMQETLQRIIEVNALGTSIRSCAKDDQPLGTICLWNYNEDRTRAEFGFELFPEEHGKGIMSAASLMLDFCNARLNS